MKREFVQQRAKSRQTSVENQTDTAVNEQACGVRPVARQLCVADRLYGKPLLLEPVRGGPVQLAHHRRKHPSQLEPQQVGKQVVVSKPRSSGIQRAHECIGVFQRLQDCLRARAAGEVVGQRPADTFEHRGAQQ